MGVKPLRIVVVGDALPRIRRACCSFVSRLANLEPPPTCFCAARYLLLRPFPSLDRPAHRVDLVPPRQKDHASRPQTLAIRAYVHFLGVFARSQHSTLPMLLILVGLIFCLLFAPARFYGRVMVGLLTAAFVVSVFSPQPGKMHVRFCWAQTFASFFFSCRVVSLFFSAIIDTPSACCAVSSPCLLFIGLFFHIPCSFFGASIPSAAFYLFRTSEPHTPQQSPYESAAKWINQHVQPSQHPDRP